MSGNETPNTPGISESELRGLKLDELRDRARAKGVKGATSMRKQELVEAVSKAYKRGAPKGHGGGETHRQAPGGAGGPGDAGPAGGHLRTGESSSKSIRNSQEIAGAGDRPERPGRSLATTNHEVIRRWAESRDGTPATVEGSEHDGHVGVLRFDFGRGGAGRLRHISWEEWFEAFDVRELNFVYQEQLKDGRPSNFFVLENPHREDA
ncbi:Rho termination factor N-terminal domain-containing protein [Rhizomonospora bruguierae]|uniref:Rho termination factor N-terminal domain-containing protein n=1 Tax=Rhizomonospora bruguierae TaxID=1581705 RepID=UPI001BCCFA31|nr:Rho termination factor N-terminal domain-containing protein [Micromonospora sp. NBRC 107566]